MGLSEGLSGHPEQHEKCAAFPMGSDAFLHLKRDSRHQRRQREKITLHRPDNPGPTVVICFTASSEPKMQLPTPQTFPTNRFRNVGPNSFSPTTRVALPDLHPTKQPIRSFHYRISGGLITDSPLSIYCSQVKPDPLQSSACEFSQQNNRYYHQDLH